MLSVEQIEIFFKAHAMLARCILGSGLFDCRLQECNCFVKRLLQGHFIDQTTGYAGSEQIASTGEAFSGVGSLYEAASLTCNSKICNPGFFGISRNNTCYDNGLLSDCLFQKGKGSFFYIAEIFWTGGMACEGIIVCISEQTQLGKVRRDYICTFGKLPAVYP